MENEDEGSQPLRQLTGVVIINLPPPDDPSQGKTITAFTISSSDSRPENFNNHFPSNQEDRRQHQITPGFLPSRLRSSSFIYSLPRPLILLLSSAVVLTFLWSCFSSDSAFDFLGLSYQDDDNRDHNTTSSTLLFPLYLKNNYPPSASPRIPNDGNNKNKRRRIRETDHLNLGVDVNLALAASANGSTGVIPSGDERRKKITVTGISSSADVNSTVFLPINGNIVLDGLYYTIVQVGNPPTPFYLDVDTGSELTWIQCDAPCSSCAKGPNPLYKPTKDKLVPQRDSLCQEVQTNRGNWHCESSSQCDYEIEYADHSSSMGVLVRDNLLINMDNNDAAKASFIFGCAYDQQGHLLASPAKTDGVLGLSISQVGLPTQLANQNIISNVLGHCIASEGNTGGYIFLGDEFVPHWGVTWVPMLSSPMNFYQVETQKISYGGQQIGPRTRGNAFGHVSFDTGSSYSYFTSAVYSDLITLLQDSLDGLVQKDDSDLTLPICWKAISRIRSVEDVKDFFKPLTFHFGSSWLFFPKELVIQPEGYLVISEKGNVCLGILDGAEILDGSLNILGDISLRGQLFVFDNIERKIGWAQSDCLKPQKQMDYSVFF